MSHEHLVGGRDVPIPTRMEETVIRPNWPRAAACLGLIAVVPFGLWMTLVALATSTGRSVDGSEPGRRNYDHCGRASGAEIRTELARVGQGVRAPASAAA